MQIPQDGNFYTIDAGIVTRMAKATGLTEAQYVDRLSKIADFFCQYANMFFDSQGRDSAQKELLTYTLHGSNGGGSYESFDLASLLCNVGKERGAADFNEDAIYRYRYHTYPLENKYQDLDLANPTAGIERFIASLKKLQQIVPISDMRQPGYFSVQTEYKFTGADSWVPDMAKEWASQPNIIIGFLQESLNILKKQPLVTSIEPLPIAQKRM